MNTFTTLGVVGLVVQASVNLIALLAFEKSSAEFFSEQWWSSWLPTYIVWLVFLIVGLANGRKTKEDSRG